MRVDEPDALWDNILAIVWSAKELTERGRNFTLQEDLMLRDAAELIEKVRHDDILLRMRLRLTGNAQDARMAVDVSEASEGGGVRVCEPDLFREQHAAVPEM